MIVSAAGAAWPLIVGVRLSPGRVCGVCSVTPGFRRGDTSHDGGAALLFPVSNPPLVNNALCDSPSDGGREPHAASDETAHSATSFTVNCRGFTRGLGAGGDVTNAAAKVGVEGFRTEPIGRFIAAPPYAR